MKKLLRITTLFLLCSSQTFADYIQGGNITWTQAGKDTFNIKITYVFSCGTTTVPTNIFAYKPCGGATVYVATKKSGSKDITPTCKSICNPCKSSCKTGYGFQEYYLTTTLYISKYKNTCCSFILAWDECCRSTAISTGPSGTNFHLESTLDRCLKKPNNSPVLGTSPLYMTVNGACVDFNPMITDPDGDSLSITLTKPLTSFSSYVPFNSPYAFYKPLKFSGFPDNKKTWNPPNCEGFHVDTATGRLNFKATSEAVTVIAYKIEEYRDTGSGVKVKIGTVLSDMNIYILKASSNKPPSISGINGTTITSYDAYTGDTGKFVIFNTDPDKSDSLHSSWNKSLTWVSMTTDHKKYPTDTYTVFPSSSHVNTLPYQIETIVTDNVKCPVQDASLSSSKSINIYVHNASSKPVYAYSKAISNCNQFIFNMKSGTPSTYGWFKYIIGNDTIVSDTFLKYTFTKTGKYPLQIIGDMLRGSPKHYFDTITISHIPFCDAGSDTTICTGSTVLLNGTAHKGKIFSWSPSASLNNNSIINPIASPVATTTYVLLVWDSTGCISADSIKIKVIPLPFAVIKLSGDTLTSSYGKKYTWLRDGVVITPNTQQIIITQSGFYRVVVTDSFGCSDTSSGVSFTKIDNIDYGVNYQFSIHPNPAQDKIFVQTNLHDFNFSLFNMLGKRVMMVSNQKEVSIDKLPDGVYFLEFRNQMQKLIIKR